MPELRLSLGLPPSINHYYKVVWNRGRYSKALTAEGRAYREAVWFAVQQVKPEGIPNWTKGTITVQAEYFFRSWRSDCDNPTKALIDALAKALGFNDNRVSEIHLYKRIDRVRPRADVVVRWEASR